MSIALRTVSCSHLLTFILSQLGGHFFECCYDLFIYILHPYDIINFEDVIVGVLY